MARRGQDRHLGERIGAQLLMRQPNYRALTTQVRNAGAADTLRLPDAGHARGRGLLSDPELLRSNWLGVMDGDHYESVAPTWARCAALRSPQQPCVQYRDRLAARRHEEC